MPPLPPGLMLEGDGLILETHVARLTADRHLAIPEDAFPIVLEIGSSDRDTMDVNFLPLWTSAFLVTCEPLIDKYAKALVRNPERRLRLPDAFQELSHHHPRGLILPMAIGPLPEGPRTFNVGNNSGCSSMLPLNMNSHRLAWCRNVAQQRRVMSITLSRLLNLMGRPVDLLKLDAQGLDLAIVESGAPAGEAELAALVEAEHTTIASSSGKDRPRARWVEGAAPMGALRLLRRFSIEVVADDCDTLYAGQPKCSEVKAKASLLGYEPIGPVSCVPHWPRVHQNSWCEFDILFVAKDLRSQTRRKRMESVTFDEPFYPYHELLLHGCTEVYNQTHLPWLLANLPTHRKAIRTSRSDGKKGYVFYHADWAGASVHAHGMEHACLDRELAGQVRLN